MILLFGIDPPIGWCFYPFIVRNSKELELQKKTAMQSLSYFLSPLMSSHCDFNQPKLTIIIVIVS
jgi:hypothetical protein